MKVGWTDIGIKKFEYGPWLGQANLGDQVIKQSPHHRALAQRNFPLIRGKMPPGREDA